MPLVYSMGFFFCQNPEVNIKKQQKLPKIAVVRLWHGANDPQCNPVVKHPKYDLMQMYVLYGHQNSGTTGRL